MEYRNSKLTHKPTEYPTPEPTAAGNSGQWFCSLFIVSSAVPMLFHETFTHWTRSQTHSHSVTVCLWTLCAVFCSTHWFHRWSDNMFDFDLVHLLLRYHASCSKLWADIFHLIHVGVISCKLGFSPILQDIIPYMDSMWQDISSLIWYQSSAVYGDIIKSPTALWLGFFMTERFWCFCNHCILLFIIWHRQIAEQVLSGDAWIMHS